jgi:hypothetical protein
MYDESVCYEYRAFGFERCVFCRVMVHYGMD